MKELLIEEIEKEDEKTIEQIPIQEIMNSIEKDLAKKYEVPRSVIRKKLQLYYTNMKKPSIEEIIEKYENGARVKDLADEYGVRTQSISGRIKRYYENKGKENPRKNKILSDEEIKEMIAEYEKGAEIKDLADEYGVTTNTVYTKIREYYVQARRKNPREVEVLEIEEVVEKWKGGKKLVDIASDYGVNPSTISDKIKKNNKTGTKIIKSTTIIIDYLRKGLTPEQIIEVAKKSNVIIPENFMQEAIRKVQGTADIKVKEEDRGIDD